MSPAFFPVVVVGAGPTGLTLANLLGLQGIPTLLVEKNATTVQEPRAVSIDDESLRTMQAVGLVSQVLQHVMTGYGSRYLDSARRCFLEVAPTQVIYGYPRRNAFRQPQLEGLLRTGLSRFEHVTTRFGWNLDRFAQNESEVALTHTDPQGASQQVRCAWLVGCDGASSSIRSALGLNLEGETFAERWLIVNLEDSPAPCSDTLVFCDVSRPCIALPGPDFTRRFEFKLREHETSESVLAEGMVAKLLAAHGAAPKSRIVRKTVYTFHARIAPAWKVGRVILAGDACHLSPPFAGQGMNSGIRDAHNLAWKLAAVISGKLGPNLLETYEQERKGHVREMIQLALRMGRIMGPSSRLAGALTRLTFRTLGMWPPARDYFGQMKYKPKPRFRAGFQLGTRGPCAALVGRLIPQPTVTTPEGDQVLLDHVLGDGFSLLALTEDVKRFATAARTWAGIEVKLVVLKRDADPIRFDGLTVVVGDSSALLGSVAPEVRELVLLVRPDRYVAAAFAVAHVAGAARDFEALRAATWGELRAVASIA